MRPVSSDRECVYVVREVKGDLPESAQREPERGLRAVEAVGAAGDEADLVVERLGASLVDAEADRGEDAVAVAADGSAEADERFEAAADQAVEQPIDQHLDVLGAEAGLEDPAGRLFELVGAPHLAARGLDPPACSALLVAQLLGPLQQAPARALEALGGLLVAEAPELVPVRAADL